MLEKAAILSLRLMALALVLGGIWFLVAHLVQGWDQIDAVYWELFLRSRLLPPAIAAAVGLVLWVMSRWLGKFLVKDLETSGNETSK